MAIAFLFIALVLLGLFLAAVVTNRRLEKLVADRNAEVERLRQYYESETIRMRTEAQAALAEAQRIVDQQVVEMKEESERVRKHYEGEARQMQTSAEALVAKTLKDVEPLRKYEGLREPEAEARRILAEAMNEATSLTAEAHKILEQTRNAASDERSQAARKAAEIREQAHALLNQATREAGRIVAEANKRAEQIGGDAYAALRDKQSLERAVKAIRNVVEGYGDRYIVPTRSLLDELATDFGHTAAGEALKAAREQSRRMVEQGQAGGCGYAEPSRRETAIRFVIDAFNGRVDAILTRVKHDNYGTLEQEIRDAYSLVNLNGQAFRDAHVVSAYLNARLAELKWAVVVQELRMKEREEQRRIQEQMREEEKARREYERAIKEAQQEEETIKKALEVARLEVAKATAEERTKFDQQIALLNRRLTDAEAKNQRALSMAQQTRSGHVYVISNIGSFGEEVFKIGMTRRLEPMDRIEELSNASVPFAFDVHAMIYSEDAPSLENLLHDKFDDLRINKVNYRKEFFRLPLGRLRDVVAANGSDASFTMVAEAHEYRETQALEKMTPEEREKYFIRREEGDDTGND